MYFPISDVHISAIALAFLGLVVGILGGFFGVGGGFLAGPMMYVLGIPMNYVVGTDLAHMAGKSVVAAKRHRTLGHVDMKLGFLMVFGTIIGIELGAQFVEYLQSWQCLELVNGVIYIAVLVSISLFVMWESRQSINIQETDVLPAKDAISFESVSKRIQAFNVPPMINLPNSGIKSISLWVILFVGIFTGFLAGLLGVGGGFIRMPALVYLIGCPTHVAVGTDLFEIVISASYGTITHSLKGNVDIMIALVMHTGAAIGASLGASLTKYLAGPKIRFYFSFLPLIGALLMIYALISEGVLTF
ncbi:MAG: hypothetical protein B6U97_04625 [Candidatus Altiarchaeales archaeon ex4484_96]|nr:MAG: hypothetical protein B6U97_04625 [Candidatus Altiarchaeales archaeon ex4484_96]